MKRIIHKKSIYVIIPILVILLFLIWQLGGSGKSVPQNLFEDIYGFELPESAVFEVDKAKGVYDYQAKIAVNQSDLEYIYKGFNNIFGKPAGESNISYSENRFNDMKRVSDWFDLNYYDIDVCYGMFVTGEKGIGGYTKTSISNLVYIRMNDDDTATLYIVVG